MSRDVVKDLGRHLQQRIGEVIEQQMQVGRMVLSSSEIALVLIEAAVSTSLTAAATVAANVDPEKSGEMFDTTLRGIAAAAAGDRERSLAKVSAMRGVAA